MKRLVIVDLSNFIFRAFFAIRPLHTPDGTPVNAVYGVFNMLLKIFSQYGPTHLLIAKDTSTGSFRNKMYEAYKANRSEPPEELVPQFAIIKELIDKMGIVSIEHDDYEADDIIGSAACQWKDQFDEVLIASGDKDLMQFVDEKIKIVDTMKNKTYDSQGVFEKMGVHPNQIVDYLSMVGDSSDNIPGMRGIGAKGAAKLLAEHGTLDECIKNKESFKGKKLTTAFSEHLEEGLLSRDLIKIVIDMHLEKELEDTKFRFYPSDELIEYLQGLGFKSVVTKLKEMKINTAQAENSTGEDSFIESKTISEKMSHHLVKEKKELKTLFELLDSSSRIAMSVCYKEQTQVDLEAQKVFISVDGETSYLVESGCEEIIRHCWEGDSQVYSFHWERDCIYAYEKEITLRCERLDIVQAHYILYPDRKHSLEFMVSDFFQSEWIEKDHENEGVCFIWKLAQNFELELKKQSLFSVYQNIDDRLIPILSRMEREGVLVDIEFFKSYEKELEEKLDQIDQEIYKTAGKEINLNSPKQVGALLFDDLKLPIVKKTKTGYSTDSEVLEKLDMKKTSPIPGLILQHREVGKLLSTYVKTLPLLVHPKTHRVHARFNQHVAATGRLSSHDPNLQNIPIRTAMGRKVREGFIAKEGHVFVGADYSQIELRLLAHCSGDPSMLEAFKNDQDIHKQTASEVLGIALDKVTSEERSKAKAVNFGLMYGQSSFGLASQLRISRTEAKDYITQYFRRFSKVKSFLDSLKEEAEKTGYAMTLFGRKRFLENINSQNRTMKAMAERMAINSPIQGTAADLIKMAMIDIDERLKKEKLHSKMILQVHDELIFEVPNDEVDLMKKLVKEEMEGVTELKVPLKVDVASGKNWQELK